MNHSLFQIAVNRQSILSKVIKVFSVSTFLVSIPISFFIEKYYLILICLFYCCVCLLTTVLFGDKLCLSILSIYTLLSGPIQMLVAEFSPFSVFDPSFFSGKTYLLDSQFLHWEYAGLSIGFHLLLVFFYYILDVVFRLKRRHGIILFRDRLSPIGELFIRLPLLKAVVIPVYAILEFLVRISFNLNVPGVVPSIPFAGAIVYIISFLHQLLSYMCLCSFYRKRKITVKSVLGLIADYIILSIPDILLDRRAPLFFLLIIAFLHMYYWRKQEFEAFVEKRKAFFIILIVLALIAFQQFSKAVRYAGMIDLPITFFLARITGLADGFVALEYLNSKGLMYSSVFRVSDFFHNVIINGDGASMRYYYTHTILGFPATAVHSSSLPLSIGSLMYSGFLGFVFMSFVFSLIFVWAENSIRDGLNHKNPSMIKLYIGCYLAIYTVGSIMGGGAESLIEIFTLPIMFTMTSVLFRN